MQRLMRLKIEWRFSRSHLSVTSIFARAFQNSLAWRCIGTAWKDYGDPIKVSYISTRNPFNRQDALARKDIICILYLYSAQSARIGMSRDSSSNDGLRHRPIAVAQVDQVALEIVRHDNHNPVAL